MLFPAAVFLLFFQCGGITPPSCNDLRGKRPSPPSSSVAVRTFSGRALLPGRPQLIDPPLWGLFGSEASWQTERLQTADRVSPVWSLKWAVFIFFPLWQAEREIEYIRGESTQQLTAALQPRFSVICSRQTRARPRYEAVEDQTPSFFPSSSSSCGILICVCGCQLTGRTPTFKDVFAGAHMMSVFRCESESRV